MSGCSGCPTARSNRSVVPFLLRALGPGVGGQRSWAQLDRRSVRWRMIEAESTFALIAELALGLAGFAGVAAAFGGRDRSYAPVELTRMRALFVHAALALSCSLLATSLLWFGLSLSQACFWSSALGLAGEAPSATYFSLRAYQYVVDPRATTGWLAFLLTSIPAWLAAVLLALGLITGGSMGFLVAGLSVQLLFGLWLFTRILTQRN
jgi:hypothetical protein